MNANGEAAPAENLVKPDPPQAPINGHGVNRQDVPMEASLMGAATHVDFAEPVRVFAEKMENEIPLPRSSPGIGRSKTFGALIEGFSIPHMPPEFGRPKIIQPGRNEPEDFIRHQLRHRASADSPLTPAPCSEGLSPKTTRVAGLGPSAPAVLTGVGGVPKSISDFEQRVSSEMERMQKTLLELHHTGVAGYQSECQSLKNKLANTENALARALEGGASVIADGSEAAAFEHKLSRKSKRRLATAPIMEAATEKFLSPTGAPQVFPLASPGMPLWLERWETLACAVLDALDHTVEQECGDEEASAAHEDDDDVELHETWVTCGAWDANPGPKSPRQTPSRKRIDDGQSDSSHGRSRVGDVYQDSAGSLQRFVMHPDGLLACFWYCLGAALVIYDMIMVPVALSFDLDLTANFVLIAFQWVVPIFWSTDICFNFLVGFHQAGVVEMRIRKICHQYLKTWFIFDVLVCSVDWLSLFLVSVGLTDATAREGLLLARGGKVFRVSKFVKLLKVIRLLKVDKNLAVAWETMHSEHMVVAMQLGRLVVCILLLAHYIACGWHGVALIGESLFDYETTWLTGHRLDETDRGYRYVVSLHWTLTQFTPSTNNIHAFNALERLYSIIVIFFSILTFSSIVSSITAAMNKLRSLNAARMKEERDVREFLSRHRVSLKFERQLWSFFRQSYESAAKYIKEEEIRFFVMLPEALRLRLHTEMYCHSVKENPALFESYKADPSLIHAVCHSALTERQVSRGSEIFCATATAQGAFLLKSGLLHYSANFVDLEVAVEEKEWIAEGALWTHWFYLGTLSAAQNTTFLELDARAFHRVVLQNRDSAAIRGLRKYSALFILHLHRLQHMHHGFTDLPMDVVDLRKLAQRAFSFGLMDTISEPAPKPNN